MIITIDGPAGSGKSTIARGLSRILNIRYIETGAMYRAVAWALQKEKVKLDDEESVERKLQTLDLKFVLLHDSLQVEFKGKSINDFLYTPEISRFASQIARMQSVRDFLTTQQRRLGQAGSSVFEGRDMGTVVFPDADWKFFLWASQEERAKRRCLELRGGGAHVKLEEVSEDMKNRDYRDQTREISPLKCAEDAKFIDTTKYTVTEVLEIIVDKIGVV